MMTTKANSTRFLIRCAHPPVYTQLLIHARDMAAAAVTKSPVDVGTTFWRDRSVPCPRGIPRFCPFTEWPLRSCEATMVYRNCSRNLRLSARSNLEATAFYGAVGSSVSLEVPVPTVRTTQSSFFLLPRMSQEKTITGSFPACPDVMGLVFDFETVS